jgi:hypothetical protein
MFAYEEYIVTCCGKLILLALLLHSIVGYPSLLSVLLPFIGSGCNLHKEGNITGSRNEEARLEGLAQAV